MSRTFEMSASGLLPADAVVECGVCWWTYDPSHGAPEHDLLPGTSFNALPESFHCPECDAAKSKFMLKPGAQPTEATRTNQHAPDKAETVSLDQRLQALEAAYVKAEDAMVGLPVHNPRLKVDLVNFKESTEGYTGIVITPWSMNIALLPRDPQARPTGAIGATRDVAYPSGTYSFLSAHLDGFGALETCNLISPLDEFDDPEVARLVAEAALEGLYQVPETSAPAEATKAEDTPDTKHAAEPRPSRRAFLGGRARGRDTGAAPP